MAEKKNKILISVAACMLMLSGALGWWLWPRPAPRKTYPSPSLAERQAQEEAQAAAHREVSAPQRTSDEPVEPSRNREPDKKKDLPKPAPTAGLPF